jgi:hypothetical protein
LEDFSALPRRDRNLIRQFFLKTDSGPPHYGMGDDFGRFATGHLRIAAGRYPTDPAIRDLISDLQTHSDEFRRLWELELVETAQHRTKSVHHPVVGPLELFCDVLTIPDRDQHLVLLTAEPASPSEQALRLLAAIGIQSMDVDRPNSAQCPPTSGGSSLPDAAKTSLAAAPKPSGCPTAEKVLPTSASS